MTASTDRTARTWTSDGRGVALLSGSPAALTQAVFSPDGSRVVTIGKDDTVRLWDPGTLPVLQPTVTSGDDALVRSPQTSATSPDGIIGAAARGRDVVLKRLDTREQLQVLAGHRGAVTAVDFSPDGSKVVSASRDGDAMVWDVASGARLHVLDRHFGRVADARWSDDGRWIVTAGPTAAGLWDTDTGQLFGSFLYGVPKGELMTAAAFRPGTLTVVTGATDGVTRAFDCELCRPSPTSSTLRSSGGRQRVAS